MNGYIAFYEDKEIEVHAESSFGAQVLAIEEFQPPKSKKHMVHVVLCEVEGEQIVHLPLF